MHFDILTLFPDMFRGVFGDSIIKRAADNGILSFNYVDIRDFTENKHRKVDDYAFGGGTGLVMSVQPIVDAYKSVTNGEKVFTVYMSPQGKVFNQNMAREFAKKKRMVILCGHYEGIDERAIEEIVDMEVSIGDFVLTGGEIPAMALVDSVARMIDGVLPNEEAYSMESHYGGLLEYPNYTRPYEIHGKKVPDILLSGHHKNIEIWKHKQALYRTWLKRPDMIRKYKLTEDDKKFLAKFKGKRRKNLPAVYDGE